jgi:hypothetical protein
MSLLQQLLGFELPDGATLSEFGLALRGGVPVWLLVMLMLAAVAAAALVYRGERVDMPRDRRLTLAALRGAALALLVALIARPAIIGEAHGQRPRGVALLVDNSASLKQADRRGSAADLARVSAVRGQPSTDGPPEPQSASREDAGQVSRAELVRAALSNPRLDLLHGLEAAGPLRAYLFGSKARRVPADGVAALLTGADDRTALADALLEIVNSPESDPPAAIVLVTDGLDNASKATLDDAAAECARQGVAVHVYGVGSTESGAVRITDAAVPDVLFADDVAAIPLRWRYRGTARATAVLSATLAGKEVAHKEVTVGPGEGRDTLTFTPEPRRGGDGQAELAVSVRLKDDPGPGDELRRPVTLSDRRVRALVVDDTPRWEFKFLQPALSRDRRVEATYLLAQGDPRALRAEPFIAAFPPREKLFEYDLVLLGDVAPALLGPGGVQTLVDFVREGGGLAVIAGRDHMPADYADTPLAEALPAEFIPVRFPSRVSQRTAPFNVALTPAGRRADLMRLAETDAETDRLWAEALGLYWHYPVTKLRPGAVPLLAHSTLKLADDTPMPLIATHNYGKGQVLFLGIDETWRWRFNAGDRTFARFWGQVAYRLGLPHLLGHGSRVQLALESADAQVGRPGHVYARLLDAEYRPFVADRVPATLEPTDPPGPARALSLDPVPGRPGEYRTLLPHDAPGRFELKVAQPEPATFGYRVLLPPGHELEPAGLADKPLRRLAKATDGGFYREEDLHALPAAILQKYSPFTVRQEALLWNPLAFLAFVGLVTSEWVLRKLTNLS